MSTKCKEVKEQKRTENEIFSLSSFLNDNGIKKKIPYLLAVSFKAFCLISY